MRLIDSETDEVIDLVLDGPTIRLYNDRLNALTEALREEARRAGGVFVRVRSDRALDEECSEVLVPHGLLAVR
jgi:predicted ATPase